MTNVEDAMNRLYAATRDRDLRITKLEDEVKRLLEACEVGNRQIVGPLLLEHAARIVARAGYDVMAADLLVKAGMERAAITITAD